MFLFVNRFELVQTTRYYRAANDNPAPLPVVTRRYSKNDNTVDPDVYYGAARRIAQERIRIDSEIVYGDQVNETRITYTFEADRFPKIAQRWRRIFNRG